MSPKKSQFGKKQIGLVVLCAILLTWVMSRCRTTHSSGVGATPTAVEKPDLWSPGPAPREEGWNPLPPEDRGENPVFVDVMSYGFATVVSLNDMPCPVVADNGSSYQVPGGLRPGKNTLRIEVRRTKDSVVNDLEVIVRTMIDGDVMELYRLDPEVPDIMDLEATVMSSTVPVENGDRIEGSD